MNRNQESHFALNPEVNVNRSRMDRDHRVLTSFDVGEVVPFYCDEVLPGDTVSISTSKVVRLQTLLTPMMDNLYLDTYYFFVSNRLVYDHWKEFCGENSGSAWISQNQYSIPTLTSPASTGWNVGTIADYLGIPTGVPGLAVSALPFRAYALIIDQWFRNQNLQDPLVLYTDDTNRTGSNGSNQVSDIVLGGKPFIATKYKDYFTSCLPAPQKGPDVSIPVVSDGAWPVRSSIDHIADLNTNYSLHWIKNSAPDTHPTGNAIIAATEAAAATSKSWNTAAVGGDIGIDLGNVQPSNLWAYPQSLAVASVNQLRQAFQIQKFFEKQARAGSRYIEVIKEFFGVTSPDARLQRAEYLGGNRIPINVNQVVQSSGTTDTSPQGNVAGYSLTTDNHGDFTRSFTEHGFIIGLAVCRYKHTYQQGLERMWRRKTKFDYYWPVFANIGEQPVRNVEIYAQSDSVKSSGEVVNDQVFGYQEAWADYRYKPSHVTGELRSAYAQSLDVWHLGDDYASLPSLSSSWIAEDKSNVDRVLAVTSSTSNQLFGDFYLKATWTRPMPVYSIPGLIDHN